MPSCSMGFCVASTKNGSGNGVVSPATVTRCSCMAWSSAACVFGGARLIVGQHDVREHRALAQKRKLRLPGRRVFLEQLGAGDVAGHQVGRELDAPEVEVQASATDRIISVLARPGTPMSSA